MKKQRNANKNNAASIFLPKLHQQISMVQKLSKRLKGIIEKSDCDQIEPLLLIVLRKTHRVINYIREEAKKVVQQIGANNESATTFSNVVHDINNMVTVMMGYTEMALKICKEKRCLRIMRELEGIVKSSEIAIQTIDKENQTTSQELTKILEEVLSLSQTHDIEIATDFPKNGIFVQAAQNDLMNLFYNLIRNAEYAVRRKESYMSDQNRALGVFVRIDGRLVCVDVVDNGIGISPYDHKRVFEPHYTTKGQDGQGMGLCSCREIVRKMGGDITFESSIGNGTTFRVVIPTTGGYDVNRRRDKMSN